VLMVTDYKDHHQSLLPGWKINPKTYVLTILTQWGQKQDRPLAKVYSVCIVHVPLLSHSDKLLTETESKHK